MADARSEVEEAIAALARGDVDGARVAVTQAVALDPKLNAVADAVERACEELEQEGEISPHAWNFLADACPSELRRAVEAWRR
jgi:hypothetical protein